jgi:excisionase family DNA binding protein
MARAAEVPVEPEPGRMALSVPESAYVFSVSVHHVWRLIATGELASFKMGRRRLISRAAIDAYIAELEAAEAVS